MEDNKNKTKVDLMYDDLFEQGYLEKDRDTFNKFFYAPGEQGYKNRKALYDDLHEQGYLESPTYEDFAKGIGLHAVDGAQQPSSTNASAAASAVVGGVSGGLTPGSYAQAYAQGTQGNGRPDMVESLNKYYEGLQQTEPSGTTSTVKQPEAPAPSIGGSSNAPKSSTPKMVRQENLYVDDKGNPVLGYTKEDAQEIERSELYYPLMKNDSINVRNTQAFRKGWLTAPQYDKNRKYNEAQAAGYKAQGEKFKNLTDQQLVQAMREEEKKLDGSTSPEALQASMNVTYIETLMAAREWGLGDVAGLNANPHMVDYHMARDYYNKNGLVDKYEKNMLTGRDDNPLLIRGWELIEEQYAKDEAEGNHHKSSYYRNLPFHDPKFAEEFGAYITARIKATGERWNDAVKDAIDDFEAAAEEGRVGQRHSEEYLGSANREQVDQLLGDVNSALEKRMAELDKKESDMGWFSTLGDGGMAPGTKSMNRLSDPEYGNYLWAGRALNDAKKIIAAFDANKLDDGLIGFFNGAGHGLVESLGDLRTWDGGISDLLSAQRLNSALEKSKKGKPLSNSEKALLEATSLKMATAAIFKEIGNGYKAGKVTGESLPFMVEMALNPLSKSGNAIAKGLAKYAQKHLGKYLEKIVMKLGRSSAGKIASKIINSGVTKTAGKVAARVVGDIAAAGGMSTTSGVGHSLANTIGYHSGNVQYQQGAGGKTHFGGVMGGDDWVTATLKGFASTTIENASEMWGEYFKPITNFLSSVGGKTLEKMHLGKINKWLSNINSTEMARLVGDFRKQTRWDGTIAEYFEEVAGNIANALTVQDMNFALTDKNGKFSLKEENSVFNAQDNLDTFLGVSLMSGAMSTAKIVGYRTPTYRAKQDVKRYGDMAKRIFGGHGNDWSTIANLIQDNSEEARKQLVVDLMQSGKYSKREKQIALQYAGAVYKSMGMDLGESKQKRSAGDQEASDAYGRGYNMANLENISETSGVYNQLRAQMEQEYGTELMERMDKEPGLVYGWVRAGAVSEEDAQKVLNYLNAKMAYDGAMDRLNDDDAAAKAAAEAHVDDTIHTEENGGDGQIHPVALKGREGDFFVVSGNVVADNDGNVDVEASDNDIVVVDSDGNRIMTNAKNIGQVGETIDPEAAKADAVAKIDGATQEVINGEESGESGEVIEVDPRQRVVQAFANGYFGEENVPEGWVQTMLDNPAEFNRFVGEVQKTANVSPDSDAARAMAAYQQAMEESTNEEESGENGETLEDETQVESTTPEATTTGTDATQAPLAVEEYNQDDLVTVEVDGQQVTGIITNGLDNDGNVTIYFDEPINGRQNWQMTPEQLNKVAVSYTSRDGVKIDRSVGETPQPQQQQTPVQEQAPVQEPTAPAAPVSGEAPQAPAAPVGEEQAPNAPTPQQAPAQPSLPIGEDGNADFSNASVQEAHDYIYNDPELDEDEANQAVTNKLKGAQNRLDQAQAALDQAQAIPAPSMEDYGEDTAGYKRAKRERNEAIAQAQAAVDAAQRDVDLWKGVQAQHMMNRAAANAAANREENPAAPSAPAPASGESENNAPQPSSTEQPNEGNGPVASTTPSSSEEEIGESEETTEQSTTTADERIENARIARLIQRAEQLAATCGIPVRICKSEDEIPARYKKAFETAKGKGKKRSFVNGFFFHKKTANGELNEIVLYIPDIAANGGMWRLERTFLHEAVAHGGLRALFENAQDGIQTFNDLCDKVWNEVMPSGEKRDKRDYVLKNKYGAERYEEIKKQYRKEGKSLDDLMTDELKREAADEYMAHLAEDGTDKTRLEKVIQAVREALRKLKIIDKKFNDMDIVDLLAASRRNLTEMDRQILNQDVADELDRLALAGEDNGGSTLMSTTSIMEGGGLEVSREVVDKDGKVTKEPLVDEEGNLVARYNGKEYSAKNPITADDLREGDVEGNEATVLQMLINDARDAKNISDEQAAKIYQNYADMINLFLKCGSAENGGADTVMENWEWLGDTVFRAVAANGDAQYSYSMDITKVCKKNEAVIKSISALQLREGRGATPSEIVEIYRDTHVEGYQVPCPVCYVFTRYIRNGKYASAAITGMEEYGEHLPGGKKPWTLKQWRDELNRLDRTMNPDSKQKRTDAEKEQAKRFKKQLDEANDITVYYEDRVNALSFLLTSKFTSEARKKEILEELRIIDAQYKAAVNIIARQSLTNWIKTFAIQEKDGKWSMREDAKKPEDMDDFRINALDLRLTSNTILNYPAIQRLRKSGGSAAGKEISFESDNRLGEVVSGLGINKSNLNTYSNVYEEVLKAPNEKERKKLRKKATERFQAASEYAQQQTLRGGQRMWSWSDNIERLSPDIAINIMQLQLLGGAMQTYSKQLEGIKLAAQMGAYVNGSLMAKDNGWEEVKDSECYERDGELWLKKDKYDVVNEPRVGKRPRKRKRIIAAKDAHVYQAEDGKKYVLVYDDIVGVDPFGNEHDGKRKKGLFQLNKELDRAGNILVGMNDLHVRAAMADPAVFFIIPWHASGANNHILNEMLEVLGQRMTERLDYTVMQEEKNMLDRNKDTKKLPEVTQRLRDLWEEGRQWAKQNKWKSGMEVDSNGDLITESQYMYRSLRGLIFDGSIFEAMPSEEQYQAAVEIVTNMQATVDELDARNEAWKQKSPEYKKSPEGKAEKKEIDKEREKANKNYKPAVHTIELHDGLIDWRDSSVNVEDAEWQAQHPKRINVEEARRIIEADEFLKQVYDRVSKTPGQKMTSGDNTYIYPYEYWQETDAKGKPADIKDADINGKRYVEYCRRMGYKPKFSGNWKTGDVEKQNQGNFVHDPGYWKLLIDRRMYDRNGKYQWLDPVDSDNFETSLVDPRETHKEFHVTKVADDKAADEIAQKVFERLSTRTESGFAAADYNKPLKKIMDEYDAALAAGVQNGKIKLTAAEESMVERMKAATVEEVEEAGDSGVMFSTSPTFYSNAERAVENIKQNKATAEQWKAMLTKVGGIKSGEDKWMGLSTWLDENKGKSLTKDEVLQFVRDNGIQMEEVEYVENKRDEDANPPYEINGTRIDYTTEGLRNLREIAFKVPNVEPYQVHDEVHFGPENQGKAVMWVRFGETTDADGNRVLVIDEIQSNRHQDAREKGYKNPDMQKDFEAYRQQLEDKYFEGRRPVNFFNLLKKVATPEEVERYKELSNGNNRSGVPAAPFEKNWHEVAMKRMLRLAAEEGFDKVAWTTGEQQTERYNLGGVVSSIKASDWGDNIGIEDTKVVTVDYKGEGAEDLIVDRNGNIVADVDDRFNNNTLADVVGKEMAVKLLADGEVSISGNGLRIGGEGMKGFYDNILPRFMDKYGKRWGVKTGTVELPNVEEAGRTMHSVDVTPEMKESVMQGQPLFSVSNYSLGVPYQGTKGRIARSLMEKLPSGRRFVDLFAGGGAMTHAAMLSGKYDEYHMNDVNPIGVELFMQGVRGEWDDYNRTSMTPEEFKQVKGTPEAIPWSVLGLGRNLVKGGKPDYINRVKRLGQLKDQADKVSNSFEDYRNVEIRPGDVVYADIPYENTDTYNYGKGRKFDKKAFCDWAQAQDFPVFVSESVMPEGWVEIASESMKTINPKKNRTEKLWVQEKFADQYREEMENEGVSFSTSAAEANNAATETDSGIRFSVRQKPAPKKTQKVYKLMRLGDDGKLYPLFIDGTEPIELGVWYDADSPNMDMLVDLPIGVHLIDTDNGTSMTMEEYVKQNNIKLKKGQKYPPKEVIKSTPNGQRWVYIEPTERGQRRFGGESRRYWNLGINGSGSVSTFSMRPGWHAGSLPTMRQIGKSRVKGGPNTFRDDRFVWVEGLISADIDYNEEAQRNPDNDIPTHIPTDGFYLKATNANAKASQADRVGWYISGAFMPVKIMSDSEARQVIDKWNAEPKHADLQVEYDFPRESGKVFNAETMQLEDEANVRFSTGWHGSGSEFDRFDHSHMGEGEGIQAYGWGTYITTVEGIARTYARVNPGRVHPKYKGMDIDQYDRGSIERALPANMPYKYEAAQELINIVKSLSSSKTAETIIGERLEELRKDRESVETKAQNAEADYWRNFYNEVIKSINASIEYLESLDPNGFEEGYTSRYLYEVEIPDNDGNNYISWNETLPKKHRIRIANVVRELPDDLLQRDTHGPNWLRGGFEQLANTIEREQYAGKEITERLRDAIGNSRAVSEVFSKAGFVGTEYPAQYLSGGRKDGAKNYVIYNEDDIEIKDRIRFSTSAAVDALKDDERVYNTMLGKVFSGVSNETRRGIVEDAMRNRGNDFGAATEAWLGGLADDGKFAQVPEDDWRTVKNALSSTLRNMGVDGTMTDNEARYVLWKSAQVDDGVFSMAEDIVMQDRLLPDDSGVRFSTTSREEERGESEEDGIQFSVTPRDRAIARDQYERWMKNWRIQFTEAFQDSMIGLKKLMQAIMGDEYGYIEDIPMYENPYIAENLMSPTTAAEQHVFDHDYMQPIFREMANLCKGKRRERERAREDLTNYLMAKHGLERNQVLADRDAQETAAAGGDYQEAYAENRKHDYSGLTALTGEDNVQAAEVKAQQMVAAYEAQHDTKELWNRINAATQKTLEKQYKSGMLSYAEYQRISGMFDYYVPLRGWEETTSDEVYGYLTSKAGPFLGSSIAKRAGGRTSKADDPIANIAKLGDDSIRTGNRNLMKQMFLNFVQNHPSDLVSVSDLWLQYDAVKDEWVPVFADIKPKDSADVVEQKIQDFEQQMAQLAQQEPNKYKHGRDAANIPYRVVPGMEKEHQVLVKRNGQTWVLTINGNPRAAQALNGLTNPDVSTGTWADYIFKTEDAVNRALSAMMTTYSPNFIVSNFARDTAYVNTMVWAKENKNYALAFHANHAKLNPAYMRFLLGRWENGTLDESKPYQKYFKEFMLNGGETGYAMAQDLDDYKKKINKELGIPNGNYAVTRAVRRVVSAATPEAAKKAGRILADQYELLGRAIENSARFAAFVTSREMGRDVKRSAYDAKEISVNFNKKGSGGKMFLRPGQTFVGNVASLIAALTRAFYTFFNAGVQGMTNVGRNLKRHPYKSSAGIGALLTMGIMQPMLAAMMGAGDGDDDDKNAYYNLPPYVRRSNLCIYLPGWIADKTKNSTVKKYMQGTWLCIPLPVEYRAIFGFGELMYSAISGNERYPDKWELAKETTAQFSQLLPVDFLEGGGGFSAFIPTSLKPMWEIHNNVGWSGAPIYKDNEWNKDDPEYTKAFSNTSEWLVDFTEWLNAKTLRNPEDEVGFLNWNPAKIEYFVKGYTGGVYSSIMEIMRAAQTAFGDREFEWRNVPLANRILKQSDERMESRNLMNEFYNLKEEYDKTKKDIDKYQKADNTDYFDYAKKLSFLNYSDRYKRYLIMDEYMDELNGLSKDLKDAKELGLSEEEIAKAERDYMAKLHEMIDEIHKFEDTGNPPSFIPTLKRVDKSRDPKLIYSKHRMAEDIVNDNLLKAAIKRAKKEGNIGLQKALEGVSRSITDVKKQLGYEGANVDEIMDSIRQLRDGALRSFGIIDGGEEEVPEPEEQWQEEPQEEWEEEPEMIEEEPLEEPEDDEFEESLSYE